MTEAKKLLLLPAPMEQVKQHLLKTSYLEKHTHLDLSMQI